MKIEIGKIKITERIRKNIDKIGELAGDIREHGLIRPISVMSLNGGEFRLLAGLRRLRAMELNGETEVDANVFSTSDAEEALKIEYSEDEREEFTFSERMDYGRLIEEIETAKTAERKQAGIKNSENNLPASRPKAYRQETRSIVGAKINMSGRQYNRAKYIVNNAAPEIIEQLDRNERTIRGTYDELYTKDKLQTSTQSKVLLQTKPLSEAKAQTHTEPDASKCTTHLPSKVKLKPFFTKLKAQEDEAVRKMREFDALSPEGKIAELKRQLKEERARAAGAESSLAREKELRQNEMYHYNATIEMLDKQLTAANERINKLK